MILRRIAAALFLCLASAGQSQPATDCAAGSNLDYICGLQKPEDVIAIQGTKWLIASGFASGAGLKLIDADASRYRFWYRGEKAQIQADHRAFPHCPGPVDPAAFNARGLSIRQLSSRQARLLVVNHGGRESIEIFDILLSRGEPQLQWRGCLILPPGQVGNSVASFADGTILTTVLTRPGTTIADFVQGRTTGGVWQWRPGEAGFTLLPGTELPGNNGIETDPDQRRFYVVAFGWHAVVMFDRADTRTPLARIEAPDFMPDNIHWTDGRLLLAGMALDEPACGGLRKVINGVADPMLCHRGWVVGELKPDEQRITTVMSGPRESQFNGISSAVFSRGALWLGSYQSARVARVRMQAPEKIQ